MKTTAVQAPPGRARWAGWASWRASRCATRASASPWPSSNRSGSVSPSSRAPRCKAAPASAWASACTSARSSSRRTTATSDWTVPLVKAPPSGSRSPSRSPAPRLRVQANATRCAGCADALHTTPMKLAMLERGSLDDVRAQAEYLRDHLSDEQRAGAHDQQTIAPGQETRGRSMLDDVDQVWREREQERAKHGGGGGANQPEGNGHRDAEHEAAIE